MRAILNSRTLTAVVAALGMALIMGFHVVAQTDPPTKHHVAAASSLEGSSCQQPYRFVKNLHNWYKPPHLGATSFEGPKGLARVLPSGHIGGFLGIQFDHFNSEGLEATPSKPLLITGAEVTFGWWFLPAGGGKICSVRITFHGLPTFVSHKARSGGARFAFHHVHSDRIEKLEITAARW